MIDINGMAHVILTVSQFDKAHKFYSGLLPAFGMTKVNDGPDFLYHVGARTAIGVRRCDPQFEAERFEQYRVGLHHICLRAKKPRGGGSNRCACGFPWREDCARPRRAGLGAGLLLRAV